jgi:hypothetical protein
MIFILLFANSVLNPQELFEALRIYRPDRPKWVMEFLLYINRAPNVWITGQELYKHMKNGTQIDEAYISGFVAGVLNVADGIVCDIPTGTKLLEVVGQVKAYLELRPDMRENSAYVVCLLAMMSGWPIKPIKEK